MALVVYNPMGLVTSEDWELVDGAGGRAACPRCGEYIAHHRIGSSLRRAGVEMVPGGEPCGWVVGTPADIGY